MNLPIVNVFPVPYQVWTYRNASVEEMAAHSQKYGVYNTTIKDELKCTICNHFDAATYMGKIGYDNELENYINDYLNNDTNFRHWRKCMPSQTPTALANYQKIYPCYNQKEVDNEINRIGVLLSEGQTLFHGGVYPEGIPSFSTSRPFSTTFSPQVALRNAEWRGKAYESDRIDLFVLRVIKPKTHIFVYRQKMTQQAHEKEVLFASGAELTLQKKVLIHNEYEVAKCGFPNKRVPIYVTEVDIS